MKTKFLLTIMIVLAVVVTQARIRDGKAITGSSLSEFGNYSIEAAKAPMTVDGQDLKTYELVYENANRAVQIGVLPAKNCTNFILKTDMFEIEYVCRNHVFGVKKISRSYAGISKEINEVVLDKVGYFAQRVITQNPKTEAELLGLIACYFPNLINESYRTKF